MGVFRLTDVSNTERESKQYWDERVSKDWSQPMHGLFAQYEDDRILRMDARNWTILRSLLQPRNPPWQRVLECACGYGRYASEMTTLCDEYIGIDLADLNIVEARRLNEGTQRASFFVADMARFDPGVKFDLIFMVAAWSSIEQKSAEIIQHLKTRLLKRGGRLVVFEEDLYMVIVKT